MDTIGIGVKSIMAEALIQTSKNWTFKMRASGDFQEKKANHSLNRGTD